MKMMKKLFALLLVLCMVFSLCACGGNSDTDDDTQKDNIESNQDDNDEDVEDKDETEDDSEAENTPAFKVTVVDEGGNPVSGCMVQVCKDICMPAMTNAEGVATISIEIEDGHYLSVSQAPEGYEYTGEAKVYLEAGQTEATITLKAVQ